MNHVNEYRLFKASNDTWIPKLKTPDDVSKQSYDSPYYRTGWDSKNSKNEEEPFFLGAKRRWKDSKLKEFRDKADELNVPIAKAELAKMGITDDIVTQLNTLGKVHNPTYDKNDKYYWLNIESSSLSVIIVIQYFVPENDYIFFSIDYNGKWLKKKFDNPQEGVKWLLSIKSNKDVTRRQQMRQVDERKRITEANEPGLDVFNFKGVDKKLNNLLGFDDFDKTFAPKQQKSTKRTDVGLDILNERKRK
jgi:hypothetical protein